MTRQTKTKNHGDGLIIIIIIIKTLFKMRVTLNSKANKPVALPKSLSRFTGFLYVISNKP